MENFLTTDQFILLLVLKIAVACCVVYCILKFAKRDATAYDLRLHQRQRYTFVALFGCWVVGSLILAIFGPFETSLPWYYLSLYGTTTPSDAALEIGVSKYGIVHHVEDVCYLSRQTFEQWNISTNIPSAIIGCAWIAYFLLFRKSSVRKIAKFRKFVGYVMLSSAPAQLNSLHYLDLNEILPICVYVGIVYLLVRSYKRDAIPAQLPRDADKHPDNPEFEVVQPEDKSRITESEGSASKMNAHKMKPWVRVAVVTILVLLASISSVLAIVYSSPVYWLNKMSGWEEYGNVVPEIGVAYTNKHYVNNKGEWDKSDNSKLNKDWENMGLDSGKFGIHAFDIDEIYKEEKYSHNTQYGTVYEIFESCHISGYHIPENFLREAENEDSLQVRYLMFQKERIETEESTPVNLECYSLYSTPNECSQIRALHYNTIDTFPKNSYACVSEDGSILPLSGVVHCRFLFCVNDYAILCTYTWPVNGQTDYQFSDLIISSELKKKCATAKILTKVCGLVALLLWLLIGYVMCRGFYERKKNLEKVGIKNKRAFKLYLWGSSAAAFEIFVPLVTVLVVHALSFLEYDRVFYCAEEEAEVGMGCLILAFVFLAVSFPIKHYLLRYLKSKASEDYSWDYLIPDWFKTKYIAISRNKALSTRLTGVFFFYPLFYLVLLPFGIVFLVYLIPMAAILGLFYAVRCLFKDVSLPEITVKQTPRNENTEVVDKRVEAALSEKQPKVDDTPMEKLKLLKSMLDAGLITQEDYDKKKDEILKSML